MSKFKETSMSAIFQNQADKYGDRACVSYKNDGRYVDISWNDLNRMIHDTAYYLLSAGVKKGDRIGLFSENRWEWWLASQATLSIGAVSVPIYATNSMEEAQYVLLNSESRICFVSTEDHLAKVLKAKKKLPKLKEIIVFNNIPKLQKGSINLSDVMKKGKLYKKKDEFDKRLNAIKTSDISSLIYTSGTTGNPKGVMLTHGNFVSNTKNILSDVREYFDDKDVFLSFMPLSHVLEMTAGYYTPIELGARVAFAESISELMENMKEIRPTLLICVPRIYEKIRAGILLKVADASPVKKAIFNFATNVAKKNLPYVCNAKKPGGLVGLQVAIADKLVFSKLKVAIGLDNLRYAISGGGPLSVSDCEFFMGMGLVILEGFGLTETTPVTNVNRPWKIKPGTVGPVIAETQIKISEDGEILVKGPQVMAGYYKNPKATKEVFTKDGWFRTGDMGFNDEDGYLRITGRIKDIIVTAGGKNISPQNVENSIKTSHFVEQVAVIGDRRKYLSALIIPSFDHIEKWARKNEISFSDKHDLVANDRVIELMRAEIDKYTKQYSRIEHIRKFTLLVAEWTQATGELTPSQKVKRRVVEDKYKKEIELMYPPDLE